MRSGQHNLYVEWMCKFLSKALLMCDFCKQENYIWNWNQVIYNS